MLIGVEPLRVKCPALSRLIFHCCSIECHGSHSGSCSANIRGEILLVGKYQQLHALKTLLLEGRVLVILRIVFLVQLPYDTKVPAPKHPSALILEKIFALSRKIRVLEGRTTHVSASRI